MAKDGFYLQGDEYYRRAESFYDKADYADAIRNFDKAAKCFKKSEGRHNSAITMVELWYRLLEVDTKSLLFYSTCRFLLHPLKHHATNKRINNRRTLYIRGRLKNKEGLLIILSHRSLHLC